jgi:hypothetical protein
MKYQSFELGVVESNVNPVAEWLKHLNDEPSQFWTCLNKNNTIIRTPWFSLANLQLSIKNCKHWTPIDKAIDNVLFFDEDFKFAWRAIKLEGVLFLYLFTNSAGQLCTSSQLTVVCDFSYVTNN